MAEFHPPATRSDPLGAIAVELAAAGFDDAHEVGRGGFGAVYCCWQRSLERTVAIKVLTAAAALDSDNLDRFLREQHAMGKLSGHPNIVSIFQSGTTESGMPYIVMQYHPRNSLDALIREAGPLSWQDSLHIGVKIAGALETAHRRGTLHRDIKPANILLTEYGEPQLTDFGIARIAGGFETATGLISGSPAFTAPEVLQGQTPTPASDLYSLGATLLCALNGHAGIERPRTEQTATQVPQTPDGTMSDATQTDIPADVRSAINHVMAGNIEDRPASAAEFGEELRRIQRRHGLTVDDMAVPTDLGDPHDRDHPQSARARASSESRPVTTRLRVILAEDDVLLREGLASLLTRSGFDVLEQAGDATTLLELVRERAPDLVMVDIRMPPTHTTEGLDAARAIRDEFPEVGILVLSAHADVEHAMELLASGRGIGYLLKSRITDVDDFIDTLQRIAAGASVVDPALVQELVSARRRNDPLAALSAREREVLALMAEGRSNAGIARRLWVTEGTVEKHVRSILTKLNLPETGDDHRRVLAVVTFLEAR
ncbi:protein kinase/transcriptional regulator [Rhodococcus opacus PD630]|uniref:protein kinase domain-containing protein n=1 Tax=Rhodococcus opacus TaxID=37919 RepID=UPI00029CBFDB|nr:protein kinase [Rhodococcus opacus]AHK34034.1 Serine/threonine-protein kinase pknK [Rhodococcus opacus PD630]EHI40045.1 protein kinase/transcriptional regulator [Rhodococcus opacus PD630]UDG96243.1 protein kinase [Rhodococcus opacus PD630]